MEYYYINTDWDALGYSPHDKWIELGHAFTSGDGSRCHYKKYGERVLGKLNSGDICLMYADGMGFVAAGKVCELWKGCAYKDEERWVYQQTTYTEYRIRVDWCHTCVDNPINAMDFLGWQPRGTLKRFATTQHQALALFEEIKRRSESSS